MRKALLLLGTLDDQDIDWLIDAGHRREVADGTRLVQEGTTIDALYVLLDGMLSVTVEETGGREVAQLRSGEIVGEISFVDPRPPGASVTAVGDATVLAIDRDVLVDRLDQDAAFGARFYRALAVFLADRLRGTTVRLGYFDTADVPENDDLDLEMLSQITKAGARFDFMLRRLRGN